MDKSPVDKMGSRPYHRAIGRLPIRKLVTVAPPLSRLQLVPALLSAALICVALACPAIGKQPPKLLHGGKTPPGHLKRQAHRVAHGQAKKAAPRIRATTVAGRSTSPRPHGQALRTTTSGGSTSTSTGGVITTASASGSTTTTRARGKRKRARAAAAATATAATRTRAAGLRATAARAAAARAAAAGTAATAAAAAAGAGSAASAPTGSAPSNAPAGRQDRQDRQSTRDRPNQFLPVTPRDELPPSLRVVRDIVHVVPPALRVLLAGLVALSILLAGAAAMTFMRSRRFDRQRRELLGHVGLLQAALLPLVPARLGSSRASVAYRPADGPGAGGDFYDVLPLAGGRTAVVIGDVSGHGRDALGRTALVRYTLRAYVEAGMEPHEALQVAGSVLGGKLEGDFVTALVAVHDAAAGTLTYATAGHPPPIVVSGAGFDPIVAATAPPLGVGASTGQRQTTLAFPRGATAFFYTDGLSEARTTEGRLGDADLERLVRELGPGATAEQVIERVAKTAETMPDDAVACVLTAEEGAAIVRSRVEWLELTRSELHGPMLAGFLQECGLSLRAVRAAELDAIEVARESGGAVIEVRMGDRPDVDVRPPDLPVREDATAYLRQP
jgi:hypothetical protein